MTKMDEPEEGVYGHTLTVMGDHLALSIDALLESQRFSDASHLWRHSHLKAVASIVHAFFAFESAVNLIGYQLFFDSTSPIYVPEEDRDIPLQLMVRRWWYGLEWETKVDYILSRYKSELSAKLKNELQECATVRNLLTHGEPHKLYILLEDTGMGSLYASARDDYFFRREDGKPKQKFANTKLSSPASVEYQDALTVNRVTLSAMKFLAEATGQTFSARYMNKGERMIVVDADLDIEELLTSGPPEDPVWEEILQTLGDHESEE